MLYFGFMGKNALERNIAIHNRIAKRYESIHGEIYNDIEQSRLRLSLGDAINAVSTGSEKLLALDFGCGAGNLTNHLADLGCNVIAADISTGFLSLVGSRSYRNTVSTLQLNGVDLSNVPSESVDIVAMYSVLHHVPDYLSMIGEFSRVLKKGGVLYIDHEASEAVWTSPDYRVFREEMGEASGVDWRKYFHITNYIDRLIRMFINPKYQREGDVHVFPDDHIEWDAIRVELSRHGMKVVEEQDYLLFRRGYNTDVFNDWKGRLGDMHLLVGRKI